MCTEQMNQFIAGHTDIWGQVRSGRSYQPVASKPDLR